MISGAVTESFVVHDKLEILGVDNMNRQMPDIRSMEAVGTACLLIKDPPGINTMGQTNAAAKLEVLCHETR